MESGDLTERTYRFAVRIVNLVRALPCSDPAARALASQLFRAGTSVGANYRAARRGRSKKEIIAKLGVVLEEADECQYWLQLIIDTEFLKPQRVTSILDEATQLTAIFTTSIKSARDSGNS